MAYNAKNLSALAYANGFTLWHYRTPDAATALDDTGYFNAAANMLRVGDFVFVNAGPAANDNGVMVVVTNGNGVVDLANLTAFGLADTD